MGKRNIKVIFVFPNLDQEPHLVEIVPRRGDIVRFKQDDYEVGVVLHTIIPDLFSIRIYLKKFE